MQLRADEAAVVEKAVRLAVESVMNVLCAVNSARTNELQRLVTDREQEVRRLEDRVREAEGELRLLRRWWSRAPEQSSGAEPADRESSAGQRECQVRVCLALLSGPPSQDPPDGMELDQTCSSKDRSVPQLPPCPPEGHAQPPPPCPSEGHAQPPPPCPSEGHAQPPPPCPPEGHAQPPPPCPSEGHAQPLHLCPPEGHAQPLHLCPPEGHAQPPPLCPPEGHVQQEPNRPSDGPGPQESHCAISKQVKQEPHYPIPAQIKQEPFCPDYGHVQPEDISAVFLQRDLNQDMSNRVEEILGQCELWQSASLEAEDAPGSGPVSVLHTGPVPSGSRKICVSRGEQSEEAMRRRRASWRAASRRYYARKMARLQTHTSSNGPGPSGSQYPPCSGPSGDMHFPLHRQVWGASSWGYSSCEQALRHHQPLHEDLHKELQNLARPPHSS